MRIGYGRDGVLYYDLSLRMRAAQSIKAEIRVFKGGELIAASIADNLSLPSGDTVLSAHIDTGEEALCSGSYSIEFYINGSLVAYDTDSV